MFLSAHACHMRHFAGERRRPREHLRYSHDVYDVHGNYVELLGRVADLSVAHAAPEAAVAKYPAKRIFIRDKARVIRASDDSR